MDSGRVLGKIPSDKEVAESEALVAEIMSLQVCMPCDMVFELLQYVPVTSLERQCVPNSWWVSEQRQRTDGCAKAPVIPCGHDPAAVDCASGFVSAWKSASLLWSWMRFGMLSLPLQCDIWMTKPA
jgi:hypothetical protein